MRLVLLALLSCSAAIKFDLTSSSNLDKYKASANAMKVLRGQSELEGATLTSADGSFTAKRWPVEKRPPGMLHEAKPPCEARGECDLVMGLASYENAMPIFQVPSKSSRVHGNLSHYSAILPQAMVGTLRHAGYDGHVILGVHPKIDEKEKAYLIKQDVTFYATGTTPCVLPFKTEHQGNVVRDSCSSYLPHMKLEGARKENARARA
jgi:hypothetical protein